ncbi:MAG: (2Fe-2S)-binding protein [Endozoicomonadaceae bacterium]|nr:(2Fe-2S)-binding protein [Endozoicomonadaceae bacterium]
MGVIKVNGHYLPASKFTVLKSLESNGYKAKSECRNGFCGQCSCEVKNPSAVEHDDNAILPPDKNKILLCSSRVRDDCTLEIENVDMIFKR